MEKTLSVDEMKRLYEGDWVLIGEPTTDERQQLLAGKVLFHSKDRDEVYDKILEHPAGQRYAFRFFGELPENLALGL